MTKAIISVLFSFLIVSYISVNAATLGKLKGKIQQTGDNGMISVSLNGNGGTSLSSGVSNAFSFNPNVGVEMSWGNFGLGIDASIFNTMSDLDFDAYTASLKGLDFLTITGSDTHWKSTSFTFGPSYSFSFRSVKPISGVGIVVKHNYPKAALRLSVKGGITLNEAPDFSVMNNVSRKEIAAYSTPSDFKKNALTLKPSVSFSYWLSQSIALSANVQYAIQTGQTAFTTGYKDVSKVDISPTISPDQFTKNISTVPVISTTTVGPDKYLSVGAGLIISFGRKGRDGSIEDNSMQSKHAINTKGTGGTRISSGVIAETGSAVPNLLTEKEINEAGLTQNEASRKGITENGLKKNEAEYVLADADVKAIAETLVNMRKGWDGTVKGGNISEKKGINEKGLKKNEAKSENINLDLTTTALTLVNLARKGWDGTVKGGNIDNETDIRTVTETLENIRKGWDGSIKGNKTAYVANDVDVKAIAETMVNLRKGWDGSVKGNKFAIKEQGVKKNEAAANKTPMNVPYTGKVNPKNGFKVSVMGSGQTDANGTPIIDGKTVIGSLYSDKAKKIYSKDTFVEVRITQAESGDMGNAVTDENGNFTIELNHDTLHTIALNGVEFGKIKLTERKGWDGTIKGSNVSVPINGDVIHVQTTPEGCIVRFADNGFKINSNEKTMTTLSKNEHADFGEKVNAGLHAAGGALAQGASLLGGALPGGAVISAAVSSVGNLAGGAGGGAAAASYARTADKKKVWDSRKDDDCDGLKDLPDGDYEFEVVIEEKASSKSKKLAQTQVLIEFSSISNVLKTKHDTAKNSVNNVR